MSQAGGAALSMSIPSWQSTERDGMRKKPMMREAEQKQHQLRGTGAMVEPPTHPSHWSHGGAAHPPLTHKRIPRVRL